MEEKTKSKQINEDLVRSVQAGSLDCISELWGQTESLVKWKANRLMSILTLQDKARGLEFEDLVQTGFVAMMDAVKTFNPENGSFSSWLMFYLQSAFAEATGYRTKRSRCDPINCALPLDAPISCDPDADALGAICPDANAEAALDAVEDRIWLAQLHDALEQILAELPEKDREVVRLRYYENKTLDAVGEAFGVGREMARRYEHQALNQLKKPRNSRRLRPFLDYSIYSGTGLAAFVATGLSVQERYLIRKEESLQNKAD